jgi:hypothetical protein
MWTVPGGPRKLSIRQVLAMFDFEAVDNEVCLAWITPAKQHNACEIDELLHQGRCISNCTCIHVYISQIFPTASTLQR